MLIKKTETATFATGCFWHVELELSKLPGVIKTEVGYMGGDESCDKISYQEVCTGDTGHAEVVNVKFDPKVVSYQELLDFFWKVHDPTQLNRQGPDEGKQYRSAIFYYNQQQFSHALASKKEAQKKFAKEIATEIRKAGKFYRAEEYHQKYLERRGRNIC